MLSGTVKLPFFCVASRRLVCLFINVEAFLLDPALCQRPRVDNRRRRPPRHRYWRCFLLACSFILFQHAGGEF